MQYILAHTPSDITLVESSMVQVDAPQLTSMPHGQRNPHSGENRIVKHLDSLNVLQERFRRAEVGGTAAAHGAAAPYRRPHLEGDPRPIEFP